MTTPKERPATYVVTGEVRLSYAHLFEPWSNDDEVAAKYMTVLLIPKNTSAGKKTYADLVAAQKAAIEEGVAKGKLTKGAKGLKDTIHDCDEEDDTESNPELAGHWRVNVSSNKRPGIVDGQLQPISDSTEVYSGCYARVSVSAFAFNTSGSKGVSFGLRNVQKTRDGEPLGGVTRPEDDFDILDEEALI